MNNLLEKEASKALNLPVLYSLRNCPYAMRARIAIVHAQVPVLLRDIVLSNKPDEMISASPKGTVPVVVMSGTPPKVIEESLDIMLWALHQNDPYDLLRKDDPEALHYMLAVISQFDQAFKSCLEEYRCAKRYHENNLVQCRERCESFINILEKKLSQHTFLMSEQPSLLDIALVPYIRQFAKVERKWYLQSPYPKLRHWLNSYLQSAMFTKVMAKHPLWLDTHQDIILGEAS